MVASCRKSARYFKKTRMKIGIILHPYGEKQPGGLPRIIYGWAEALISIDTENEYVIFVKEAPKVSPDFGGRAKVVVLGSGRFWLNRLKGVEQCDVYLFNTPVVPLFWKPKCSVVIALDYPYKHLPPRDFSDRVRRIFIGQYHRYSLKRADAVIAVSHSTKRDTVKFFNIPPEKIHVIYHGFKKICEVKEVPLSLPPQFFFFAGTMKERKNVLNIIKGFEYFIKKHPDDEHQLVLAGKNEGIYYEILKEYIHAHSLETKVIFVGHLNEGQLSFLYKRGTALIFPSIVEGTGFPILEAMGCSVPVVTSNIFGPAELGAHGGAVLVDPYTPEAIGEALSKIISDGNFKKELIEKGFAQAARFSWKNTGKETKALLEKVYDEKNN